MSHHRNPGGCVGELIIALEEIERGDIVARLRETIQKQGQSLVVLLVHHIPMPNSISVW